MKQCSKCGANNDDYASYCLHCGQSLADAGEYKPPVVEAKVVDPGSAGSETPSSNPATLWLILNIVGAVFFCCCSLSGIIHIVGIVFASQASSAYNTRNMPLCLEKTNTARILFIVGAALGAATYLISMFTGFFHTLRSSIPFHSGWFY